MAAAGKSIYLFAFVIMLKLGIDIGSRNTKIVIYNDSAEEIEYSACHSTELSILEGVNHLIAEGFSGGGWCGHNNVLARQDTFNRFCLV